MTADVAQALPSPLPLFPLRSVLFPDGVLGLKVFEARYLDLISRCLREGIPFGVVCLQDGAEAGAGNVRFERVGTLAHVQPETVDAAQAGILTLRCRGGRRFELQGDAAQDTDGLWRAEAEPLDADAPLLPPPAMLPTVQALAQAIKALRAQGVEPVAEPLRLDDAGWVANRWCELVPISLAARQRLMALPDPVVRLSLVDEYLRGRGIVDGGEPGGGSGAA